MKFLMEFSYLNISKFGQFIKLCCKTFIKTGIIMTLEKDSRIRIAPDPFSISDKFDYSIFETKVMEIYKNFTYLEYPLIPPRDYPKNSTYDTLELITNQKNDNNINNSSSTEKITFRISKEQFSELNSLLNNSFISSNKLVIKAAKKPDFLKKEHSNNYSNAYLSIYDLSKNSTKRGILFKPLKKSKNIYDYEDDVINDDSQGYENYHLNVNLGNFLYSSPIKSKFLKKFCSIASNNFNKNIIIYTFRERDDENEPDKSYLFFSYLDNNFYTGCFLHENPYINDTDNTFYMEELKKIYKITINSEILIKLLKNFNNDQNNPDHISLWAKGLVMKTLYTLENDMNLNENNGNNEGIDDLLGEEKEEGEEGNNIYHIIMKSLIFYQFNIEVIEYDENEDEKKMSKKDYVLYLIKNNIDDKHEELNKSFDCSFDDIKEKDIYAENNSFLDDDAMSENNDNDINSDDDKSEVNKKKAKNKKKSTKKKEKKKEKNKNE